MTEIKERQMTGGDVRAARNRPTPVVTQDALQEELGWPWPGVVGAIENGVIEVTQEQLERMIEAVGRVVARRQEREP